ncbi:spore coat protein [Bacillus sp. NPDC093026]|uniref:spore coat protein n=1 Tax=Bacillus sp. NPDC093026 TaxID=3363948 RepID=UPI00382B51A1
MNHFDPHLIQEDVRRPFGFGFGRPGFGRPGFGFGGPGFGFGRPGFFGSPFLGGFTGGLLAGSLLTPGFGYGYPYPPPYPPYPYY